MNKRKNVLFALLLVCLIALSLQLAARVMLGLSDNYPNHTVPQQATQEADYQYVVHISFTIDNRWAACASRLLTDHLSTG